MQWRDGTRAPSSGVANRLQTCSAACWFYDNFTIFVRLFLFSFTALVILSLLTGIARQGRLGRFLSSCCWVPSSACR